jgi:hypothetical protein
MKLLNWVRFTWDLTRLPFLDVKLPQHYQIGPTSNDDEKEIRKVFSSTFLLDPAWNPAIGKTMQTIQSWLDQGFASDRSTLLALRHGLRIIGATVLSLDPNADNHLAPGPCVLMEYRNRGFGTSLLESSLKSLRDAGLSRATAIARENAPVAKFLYRKFDGVAEPADIAQLLAA